MPQPSIARACASPPSSGRSWCRTSRSRSERFAMYPSSRPIDDLRAHRCPTVVRATVSARPREQLDSAPRFLQTPGSLCRDAASLDLRDAQQDDGRAHEQTQREKQAAIENDERHAACVLDRQVITRVCSRQSLAALIALFVTLASAPIALAATPLGVDLAVR